VTGSLLLLLLRALTLAVDPADVVFHVVHAGEDSGTFFTVWAAPFALDAGAVLGLVPCAVLLAGEAASERLVGGFGATRCRALALGTAVHAAEQMLAVPVVVLAQVTAAGEGRARCATWEGAAPGLCAAAAAAGG
jgi:hypothetical protein